MAQIVGLRPVQSIQVGPGSTVAPDGTIIAPAPWDGAEVRFSDGVVVHVERPLTLAKVLAAYQEAATLSIAEIDGLAVGTEVGAGGPP